MQISSNNHIYYWWGVIGILIIIISVFHYTTPTTQSYYHLIYMQSYFIPILIGAFQFGVRGGFGAALVISAIYFPHIMLHWGGSSDQTLMRILQVIMFNVVGYLTGLKAQREQEEKHNYQWTAERLERSLRELEHQSEKLAELEQQLRLLDRLSIVGELTASLAHEVRNPLGAIRGAVDILKDEIPENPKLKEFFNILIEETGRLNATVENYLGFARRPQGTASDFDVRDVIQNVTVLLASRARRRQIQLQLEIPDKSIFIHADANQVRQIIANLLLNAIQVMTGGEIRVSVRVISDNETPYVEIAIADQGPGIPESEIGRIFQPFYTTRKDGTGLGLSIVKRIVDENRWDIRVESIPGKGATFCLLLPLKKEKTSIENLDHQYE